MPALGAATWFLVVAVATAARAAELFDAAGAPSSGALPLLLCSPAAVVVLAVWRRGVRGVALVSAAVLVGAPAGARLGEGAPFGALQWILLGLAGVVGPMAAALVLRSARADLRRPGGRVVVAFVVLAVLGAAVSAGLTVALLALWHLAPADVPGTLRLLAVDDIAAIVVTVPTAFVLRSARSRRRAWPPRLGRTGRHTERLPLVGVALLTVAAMLTTMTIGGTGVDVVVGAALVLALVALADERRRRVEDMRRAVGDLALDRARFESFADDTPDGVLVLDALGHIESVNSGACSLFDATPASLVGRSLLDVLPAPEGVDPAAHLVDVLASGTEETPQRERDATTSSGRTRVVDLTVARVDVDGRWGYIAKVRDRHAIDRPDEPTAAPVDDSLVDAPVGARAAHPIGPRLDATGVAIDLREPPTPDVLVVHYQPILDLARGRVAAVEAFPRLRRDDGSLVGSAELVSAWERTGLAGRLGEVMLPRALGHLAVLRSETGYEDLRLFAEVSPHQLTPALVEVVRTWLARFDLPAGALLLEVTETAPIDTMDDALDVLRALHSFGVGTALDDFGTGHTRLDLVPDLPIDTVKIDASFVRRVANSQLDHDIVETIVTLARRRRLTVVAEGVETVEQVEELTRLGCVQAQGDLFGRPTDVDQLRYLLREWSIVPAIATSRDR